MTDLVNTLHGSCFEAELLLAVIILKKRPDLLESKTEYKSIVCPKRSPLCFALQGSFNCNHELLRYLIKAGADTKTVPAILPVIIPSRTLLPTMREARAILRRAKGNA